MIRLLKDLVEKVDNMYERWGMSQRDGKYMEPNGSARKKQNSVSDKNSFMVCISRLDTVEERINELANS